MIFEFFTKRDFYRSAKFYRLQRQRLKFVSPLIPIPTYGRFSKKIVIGILQNEKQCMYNFTYLLKYLIVNKKSRTYGTSDLSDLSALLNPIRGRVKGRSVRVRSVRVRSVRGRVRGRSESLADLSDYWLRQITWENVRGRVTGRVRGRVRGCVRGCMRGRVRGRSDSLTLFPVIWLA